MVDTSKIHDLISRARRRLRLQAALELAATAAVLAFGCALVVVYLVRQQVLSEPAGVLLLGACAGMIVLGALAGALTRLPTHLVAARIDRASGLADRLSTACAFEALLRRERPEDPRTEALMHAAIRDAVEALPRADVKRATPFRRPRDSRAALTFGVVCLAVSGLYWPDPDAAPQPAVALDRAAGPDRSEREGRFVEEDLDYTRDLLEDMRRVAQDERDTSLQELVSEIEALLAKAELGEISKEELLERLARAEERFMQGADQDMEATMSDLAETGRELEKSPLTRELGEALRQGDMAAAQKQLEELARKIDSGEISAEQREQAAKAMEQAAQKFSKKDARRDQALDQQMEKAKAELRRLERKQEQARSEQEKRRLARRLERKQRELKRLEREKQQRQQSAQRRALKRLHRNMEQASEQMRQQDQEQQRMASRSLRNAARDTGQVDADRRKMAAQKKVASQLEDLKEAMRRARQRGNRGPKDLFGKNQRNQDFQRRAQGQQGSRKAWRPGSRGPTSGRISQGQQPGQQGQQPGQGQQQPGGQSHGDQHDPNVLGDPTQRVGKTQDESVSGVHGRGPSRRETILSAAQKGFSNRSYEQVYAEYKNIVEEVIRAEKVPSGYKYYVKRYFQKIKPHSMD